jgi:hypothetical protein
LNLLTGALEQLVAEGVLIGQRASAPPVSGQQACQQLTRALDALREKSRAPMATRPRLDADAVWAKFAAAKCRLDELNALEFRTLCCTDATALRPEFVGALEKNSERLESGRCIYGLAAAYFAEWRSMKDAAAIERVLTSACERYEGRNPAIQKWRSSRALFSAGSAGWLALAVCAKQQAVNEVLAEYYVGPLTRLGLTVRASAARAACDIFREAERSSSEEWALQYLRWITESVLSEVTFPDAFYESISALILSDSAKRSEAFQRALRSYVQGNKRLGDPRIPECSPKWATVSAGAAQRYLSWLARDSILFFFSTILPDSSENRARRDFWLGYHDRIRDFQVAVSRADLWKLKANRPDSEFISYSQLDHQTTSAFLMKFEGYGGAFLVVEFSETGHAANVFRFDDFEKRGLNMRSQKFELKRHLMSGRTDRILHPLGWQPKARYDLASKFGIQP